MIAFAVDVAMVIYAVALLLGFVRLVRGPHLEDRALALDLMTTIGIAVAAVIAIREGDSVFLDVAVVLALIAFLGTVAFARYLERGEKR